MPLSGYDAARRVAPQLEREHARRVAGERQRLQVEHQLRVLGERVGHAGRRARQLALDAAVVTRLDQLNPAFDLAHFVEVRRQPRAIGRAQRIPQAAGRGRDRIEDALVLLPPRAPLLGRRADAEQLIEGEPRIANHRQRLRRRRPADGVGVDARIAVRAAARLIDRFDAHLHRRNRASPGRTAGRRADPSTCRRTRSSPSSASDAPASGTPRSSGSDRRRSPASRTPRRCARRCCDTIVR